MTTILEPQTTRPTHATTLDTQGSAMLLNEALARSRQREAEQAAREHRLARALCRGRGWARLARYCARRAERARVTAR
jgi:hypothetical protein